MTLLVTTDDKDDGDGGSTTGSTPSTSTVVRKKKNSLCQYCNAYKQQAAATAVAIKNYREAGLMYGVTHRIVAVAQDTAGTNQFITTNNATRTGCL
jgi:N-acetyl-beta-hexosaminidase